VRRFVSNFVELVKFITTMLRKGNQIKWTSKSCNSFDQIKKALTEAHVLISPNYSKEFLIFSFDSFDIVLALDQVLGRSLVKFDLFWDFDSLSKTERKTKQR
jgi:hypothetical protein